MVDGITVQPDLGREPERFTTQAVQRYGGVREHARVALCVGCVSVQDCPTDVLMPQLDTGAHHRLTCDRTFRIDARFDVGDVRRVGVRHSERRCGVRVREALVRRRQQNGER